MNREKIIELVQSFRSELVLLGLSVLIIFICIVFFASSSKKPPANITPSPSVIRHTSKEENVIAVDISGAVIKPNVYTLPFNSRVKDAISVSGGLAKDADLDYIHKSMNLAQKLSDGQKIYLPWKGEQINSVIAEQASLEVLVNRININSATSQELDGLPGIGEVTVVKIISNRPYSKVEDLLTKKIVKQNVYEQIKELVSVGP